MPDDAFRSKGIQKLPEGTEEDCRATRLKTARNKAASIGNKYLEKQVHSSNRHPLWTPDGQKVIFASFPFSGGSEAGCIYIKKADGTGTVEKLYTAPDVIDHLKA